VRLSLKVVPGASSAGIAGWLGDSLKVRVTAPAESGQANAAVRKLLAAALDVPASSVEIVSGRAGPRKVVEIRGLSEAEAADRLARRS
jgi:uncharacterized protein (TIGR00251 family)